MEYPPEQELCNLGVWFLLRPNGVPPAIRIAPVYALQYHFVTVTKYRADILTDERLERVAEVAHEIAEDFEADIQNVDGGTDHVHILFMTKPTTNLTKFINSLKGVTSRRIRKEYPEVKDRLEDAFWQPGYFLTTTGQVSIDVLMDYVENQ